MVQPECDKESSPISSKGKEEEAITEAVSRVVARMHGIEAGPTPLGPVLTSEVKVDGATTQALLDTGSPVSIISLDFILQAESAGRSRRLGEEGAQTFSTNYCVPSQLWGS